MSRPARTRGLKRAMYRSTGDYGEVASRADAWIETGDMTAGGKPYLVASRADAWIETQ